MCHAGKTMHQNKTTQVPTDDPAIPSSAGDVHTQAVGVRVGLLKAGAAGAPLGAAAVGEPQASGAEAAAATAVEAAEAEPAAEVAGAAAAGEAEAAGGAAKKARRRRKNKKKKGGGGGGGAEGGVLAGGDDADDAEPGVGGIGAVADAVAELEVVDGALGRGGPE
jgi:hypothetical protein